MMTVDHPTYYVAASAMRVFRLAMACMVVFWTGSVQAQGIFSHSRSTYPHWINLMDEDGQVINLRDREARPYSPTRTCGRCHNVDAINHGWHFNANFGTAEAGRPGEPWILTDPATRTQLPLSYRKWPGTFHPDEVGMDEWHFIRQFARHMSGGGPGYGPRKDGKATAGTSNTDKEEDDPLATPEGRWHISGYLENDCMMCHAGPGAYDVTEWARQVQNENFKWAPTAAVGLGRVVGDTRRIPNDFDPEFPEFTPGAQLPQLQYDASKQNADNRVFFDIVRKPAAERCYYCHSTHETGEQSLPRWQRDPDVHVMQGMNCADCHRHGIDHNMVRGFEGEAAISPHGSAVAALSCAGCHTGVQGSDNPQLFGGRLGAPIPEHKGIPPLHFESLTCTACHSGPWPQPSSQTVQTSLAHALGQSDEHRHPADPPHITQPVFVRNAAGKIEPHRMMWPTYWGVMTGDQVKPLPIEQVQKAVTRVLRQQPAESAEGEKARPESFPRGWAPVTKEQIAAALTALQKGLEEGQIAVYVTGGRLHKLDGETVTAIEHTAAEPYSWPLAHDVRPANQALGARGCMDCHAPDSPFIAGLVAAQPISPNGEVIRRMHELQNIDPVLWEAWARGFGMRNAFKIVGFAAAGLIGLVLLWLIMQAFSAIHLKRRKPAAELRA